MNIEKQRIRERIRAARVLQRRKRIWWYFPSAGPLRRELYPKQMEFFAAGARYKERLFMAANRVGKSDAGAFEITCHLTGNYPDWWPGWRFSEPVEVWACGTTCETTRDIVQAKLLGPMGSPGTGMIPADCIKKALPRRGGIAGAIEIAWIKHRSGRPSVLGFKSYEQGRRSFEGTAKHVIWCDEEPPEDCYTEMLLRTLTTRGITLITFTPLQGMTTVVKGFLEPENEDSRQHKCYVQAGWDDVPHIPEEEKQKVRATAPPYQIKARTLGEPALGAGAIYPIAENDIMCQLFTPPENWPRAYGMDVGWNRTAAIWGARDPGSGVIYLYNEHYERHQEPAAHAAAIRSRGEWIPGVIDPGCLASSQADGRSLMEMYRRAGLNLTPAVNAIEAGIQEVWQLLVSGKLKVMPNCENWLREFRRYHRDDKGSGSIVQQEDHLMDATRYLIVSGRTRMLVKPIRTPGLPPTRHFGPRDWMA